VFKRDFYDGNQPEGVPLYTYTILESDGIHWMDDSDEEIKGMLPVYEYAKEHESNTFLLEGLGLGVVIKMLLSLPSTERIDVVEYDQRVIDLVGPCYPVRIHHADVFDFAKGLTNDTWDVILHDTMMVVGENFAEKSLREADELEVLYEGRGHQITWGREFCL
jgi:spermidine synthase